MSGLVKKGPYRMAGMLEFALAYDDISRTDRRWTARSACTHAHAL